MDLLPKIYWWIIMFNQNVQEENVPFQWRSLNLGTPRPSYFVYIFFATSIPHKINESKTFFTLPSFLFLVIMFASFIVFWHTCNNVRLLEITDNSQLSSGPPTKLGRSVHSLTCPFERRTMYEHLHVLSALLIIAKSMDIHPNPGPTAIRIQAQDYSLRISHQI